MSDTITKSSAIITQEPTAIVPAGADALLSQAIAAGASIDTIERLMALRKEMLAEKAKEEFNAAMAAFQAECPVIQKTKAVKTKSGAVAYKYAPIESIVSQVKTLIEKHGFRYRMDIQFNGSNVKAFCHIMHKLGHEEVSPFEVPLGNKTDIMSQTQVVAAASTFAKRYAFLNAFGIMTGDEDNDAAPSGEPPATSPQKPKSPAAKTPPSEPRGFAKVPPSAATIMEFMTEQTAVQPVEVAYEKAMTNYLWSKADGEALTSCCMNCIAKLRKWKFTGESMMDSDGNIVGKIIREKTKNLNEKASVALVDVPEEEYAAAEDAALKAA